MEELVKEAIKQVPALAVLAFLVWCFLSHLSRLQEKILTRVTQALDRNTEAFARNSELLNQLEQHLGVRDPYPPDD